MCWLKAGLGLGVTLALWIGLVGLPAATLLAVPGSALAQSLTPPAGQPRITAPGGRRGKAARRGRRHRR